MEGISVNQSLSILPGIDLQVDDLPALRLSPEGLRALPVVAYSAAFASPFFFLALFPTLLKTMPRAGSWMNSVKVVMFRSFHSPML